MSAMGTRAFVALGSNRALGSNWALAPAPGGVPSPGGVESRGPGVPSAEGHLESCAGILDWACEQLEGLGGVRVLARSRWIRTEAVGGPEGQADFVNGVVELEVQLDPESLLLACQGIEARAGRDRRFEEHHGPRTLDLDLLLMGCEERQSAELTLPHPRMEDRLFVLEPLAEIDPDLRLPACGCSVAERVRLLRAASSRVGENLAPSLR